MKKNPAAGVFSTAKYCFLSCMLFIAATVSLKVYAAPIVIDFDAVTSSAEVAEFYNGGTDSAGASGTNYGVAFFGFLTASGFGETSAPNLATGITGTDIVDVAAGFSSLSFTYGNFSASTINVYSGLHGTGTLLGSGIFNGDPTAFTFGTVNFSGIAQSFVLLSGSGEAGLDDITFDAVPEPASCFLLLGGLGLIGLARAQQKKGRASQG